MLCLQALGIAVSRVRPGLVCLHSSQPASILPSPPAQWDLGIWGRSGVLTLVGGCLPVPCNGI